MEPQTAYFSPATQEEQITLGEHLLTIMAGAGARIIAEDLGTVPDYVRTSLARLGVPGYKVLRWEREWDAPGGPFHDPAVYPPASVAATGTHDTEPLAAWWDGLTPDDRAQVGNLPALRGLGIDWKTTGFTETVRDPLLETIVGSGSNYVLLPIQDVFG